MNIGDRIRSRRMQLQFSITELSKRSGLSSPFLSQLEHGHTQASLDSLLKIAKALEVSLSYFTPDSNGHNPVRSPQQFHYFSLETSDTKYARMGLGDSECRLEPLLVTLPPRCADNILPHLGEAFLLVLQGVLRVCISGEEHLLLTGHTAHLKPGVPYSWCNDTPEEVRLFWVVTPKLF